MASITQNKNDLNFLKKIFQKRFEQNEKEYAMTANGDPTYKKLGDEFLDKFLELYWILILPTESVKYNNVKSTIDGEFVNRVQENKLDEILNLVSKKDHIIFIFKYLFYLRDIRNTGSRYKAGFVWLFVQLERKKYSNLCYNLIPLIIEYGCVKDLNNIITVTESSILKEKCFEFISTKLHDDLTKINFIFPKNPSVNLLINYAKEFKISNNKFEISLAAKWCDNEKSAKKKGEIYYNNFKNFFINTFFSITKEINEKTRNLYLKAFRIILKILREKINIVENNFRDNKVADIDFSKLPAVALQKYSNAFTCSNNNYKNLSDKQKDDRRIASKNYLQALDDGKIKGATVDILNLSKELEKYLITNNSDFQYKIIMSDQIIRMKLNNIFIKHSESIKEYILDKKGYNIMCIPVIDVSGSMFMNRLLGVHAMVMGVLLAYISDKCFITFTNVAKKIKLSSDGDFIDWINEVLASEVGYSTNVDSTFLVVKDIMNELNNKISSFKKCSDLNLTLVYLSDMQFNSGEVRKPAFERLIKIMGEYGLPRTIFWNLSTNYNNSGYPVESNTLEVELYSGLSVNGFKDLLTNEVKYNNEKANINAKESLLNRINNEVYDNVEKIVLKYFTDYNIKD